MMLHERLMGSCGVLQSCSSKAWSMWTRKGPAVTRCWSRARTSAFGSPLYSRGEKPGGAWSSTR